MFSIITIVSIIIKTVINLYQHAMFTTIIINVSIIIKTVTRHNFDDDCI